MNKIDPTEIELFHEKGLFIPERILWLGSSIDDKSAARFIKNLLILLHISKEEPIGIYINNWGGSTYDGFAIYDAIKTCPVKVWAHVQGACFSAAAFILQAADYRSMSPSSRLMLHIGSEAHEEDHPENIEKWARQYKKDGTLMESIFLERIQVVQPSFNRKKIKEMLRFDTILEPAQALELNLIDEVQDA